MRQKMLAVLFVFLMGTPLFAESTWFTTYSEDKDCQIEFPITPQKMKQALTISKEGDQLVYDIYRSPYQSQGVFLLLIATYPKSFASGHEMVKLEGLLRGIVSQNAHNQLIFSELVEFMGKPAMSFLVHGQSSYFRGHAIMVKNKLYLIAMEGRKEDPQEKVFLRFMQSFKLLNQ